MQGKALAATDRWSELTEDGMLHLQEVIDACDVGLCLVDRDKRALIWNPWLADYLDSPYEMKQRPSIEALIPALQGPRFDSMVHQAIAQSQDKGRSVRKKQSTLPRHLFSLENGQFLRVSVRPMMMHPGFCLVQLNELSTERKPDNSPGLSGLTENTTQAILASVEDAVILVNAQGKVEFVNLAAESMTGFQSKRIAGHSLVEVYQVYDEASQSSQLQTFEQILADDSQQLVLVHREGLTIPIQQTIARLKGSDGQLEGFVLVFKDTSQSRKLAAQLNWQSSHDPITRLYNRAEFDRRLSLLLEETQFEDDQHCLLYLDIDRFIIVNDNCGYAAGDELLRQLAALIKRSIRNSDLIARLGGDEFGILLTQCTLAVAERIAESIRQSVQDFRFAWGDKTFSQSLSIGMIPIDRHCDSVEQILGYADIACLTAKEEGRNKIHIYDAVDSSAAKRHGETQWVTRIRTALEEDRFTLYVQPISSLNDGDGVQEHVEVLIRLLDEDENLIPPGAFIPAAERFGLMLLVDRWVVDQVTRFITSNRSCCLSAGRRFFVNLSGHSVCDDEFLQWILLTIREREIPAGMLCFEVTETAAISNLTSAEHFMRTLQRYGCEFALDDFGSGLSSFGYLKHLPVEYLKIDGAFVHDMLENEIDDSMVEAINRIGHIVGLETIAEFVESEEIQLRLKAIGVDYAQGYGVCRPFPIKHLLDSNAL